jgi:methyl-accepting chemotaxis protein
MRLRGRLMVAFQSLAVIILVAGGIGVFQIIQLRGAATAVSDVHTPYLYQIQRAQNSAIHANLTLTGIGAGFLQPAAIVRVEEYLAEGNSAVDAILEGGEEVLGQTLPATDNEEVRLPVQQMRGYLDRMGFLAQQQMDAREQFGQFSSALEGNFRNALLAYINEAERAETRIVKELTARRQEMHRTAQTGIYILAGATLASLLVAMVLALLFSGNIIRRVHSVMEISADLARGDFTTSVAVTGSDEVAELGTNITTAVQELGEVVATVVQRVRVLGETGRRLAERSEETAATVDGINTIVDQSRDQNEDLVANVTETSAVIEQMARNIESLDGSIQHQSAAIEQSSASVEEMISSIENISQVSTRARNQLETLSGASRAGRDSLNSQETLVTEMADAGKSLQEANQLIAGVAGQTNLLAMNAAIEAAHAGEYGRGFAVVAEEIRKLAETTSTQSNQVKKDIRSMQQLISRLVEGSTTSSDSFGRIQNALEEVHTVFEEIFSAMEEQRTGGSEILTALSQMRDITGTVHDGSREMKDGNAQMLEAIRNVTDITQQSRDAMQRIGEGMTTIAAAMADVASISDLNRSQIADIVQATGTLTLPDSDSSDREPLEVHIEE